MLVIYRPNVFDAFVQPANIAVGPQQVNNGPSRADNPISENALAEGAVMATGWCKERRERASQAVHRWRPWDKVTGPKSPVGNARSSMNSLKHAARSLTPQGRSLQ